MRFAYGLAIWSVPVKIPCALERMCVLQLFGILLIRLSQLCLPYHLLQICPFLDMSHVPVLLVRV